jgi:hypothetical protein
VNGERIAEVKGIAPIGGRKKEVPVLLKKGATPFRLEYVQVAGEQVIQLGYKGPKDKDYKWLSDSKAGGAGKAAPKRTPIPIEAKDGYAAVYRNFIAGTTPRAIGFGFPNATNLAYSADNCAVELLWTGKFMDGSHHWTDRGAGNEPPAGEGVVKVSDGPVVSGPKAPSGNLVAYQVSKDGGKETSFKAVPVAAEFKGYQLDKAGNPTFKVAGEGFALTDGWKPEAERGLTRTLAASGDQPVTIVLARGQAVAAKAGAFDVGRLTVRAVSGAAPTASGDVLTLTLKPGETAVLGYSFR